NATLFVRPQELFPEYGALPIFNATILACLAFSLPAVARQLAPSSLLKDPIVACAVCLFISVILSHLSHFKFGEALDAGIELIKVLISLFLLVALLDSFARLRRFLLWICLFVVAVVSLALLHYYQIITIPALEAYHERQELIDEETGQPV